MNGPLDIHGVIHTIDRCLGLMRLLNGGLMLWMLKMRVRFTSKGLNLECSAQWNSSPAKRGRRILQSKVPREMQTCIHALAGIDHSCYSR
jgi:hypothetical protein